MVEFDIKMTSKINKKKNKRLYLKTYGCQMNFHDSERILGMMQNAGYDSTDAVDDADVVILNTCAVREKPENKLFAELGRIRKKKKENPDMIVSVSGCMAPRDGDIIRTRAPFVDILIGPRSIYRLPDLVRKVELQRQPVDAVDLLDDPTPLTSVRRANTVSAWVDVVFGCNYQCTFCVVPSARGDEASRPPEQIFEEVDELYGLGYKEITLLGQTVNAYGRDYKFRMPGTNDGNSAERTDFTWLLEQIDRRAPQMRVRFTSPHPQLFSDRLIKAIADLPTVCEHVHLPLQSADNKVLKNMKRSYTYERFLRIVEKLRKKIPDIAITTDIIAGFPGETDKQFQRTLNALEEIEFDQAFMFAYSARRNTAAYGSPDEIPADIKKQRLNDVISMVNSIAQKKNKKDIGRELEVLVEGPSEKKPERLCGRTRGNKMMIFDGAPELTGQLVTVKVERAYLWGYQGIITDSPHRTI